MRKHLAYLSAILVGGIVWFSFNAFQILGTDDLQVVRKEGSLIDRLGDLLARNTPDEREPDSVDVSADHHAQDSPLPEIGFDAASTDPMSQASAATPPGDSLAATRQVASKATAPVPRKNPNTIRVASFHLQHFGSSRDHPDITMNAVARVVRLFDVLALQGVSPGGEASLAELVSKAGSQYDYLVGNTAIQASTDQLFAFVYNRDTIVADRGDGLYTLGDPDNLLQRDPLIGWFRAKQAPEEQAFTFSLVNVHADRRHVLQELRVLDDVFHEVRQDWRNEDDVIMLGCFYRDETKLGQLTKIRGLVPAVRGVPTDVRGQQQTENILFRRLETDEFTGRSGVFHFLRAYNLSLNQALQVSEYLPVWAEFSIFERKERVARR